MLRSQLLKGVLDIAVLAALDEEPSYGYAILTRLEQAGLRGVGDASVYGTLRRLEDAGHLRSQSIASESGPPRRYFSLTATGRATLAEGIRDWDEMKDALGTLFDGRGARRA
ncbi:MAG TPA: PadR family transcriptional regulator [Candidatus Dormibacteraeota bacterium]|nr:PadR family transcriptional regulator [Candidatus Dormibacteraeota bacterium]